MNTMADKNYVLSYEAAQEKLHRMALEIAELVSEDEVLLMLIGIRQSGLVIAKKIASFLEQYIKVQPKAITVMLDKDYPKEVTLSEEIDFNGKNVILVDDVSNSGRTLMYALRPLLDFHPKRVLILVLVERMHKQFPIKPDFVGVSVATTVEDYIQVEIENGEVVGAFVKSESMVER
jgi:pyrimidine operon attenuation protein/uracil phosphoribosyltransferase